MVRNIISNPYGVICFVQFEDTSTSNTPSVYYSSMYILQSIAFRDSPFNLQNFPASRHPLLPVSRNPKILYGETLQWKLSVNSFHITRLGIFLEPNLVDSVFQSLSFPGLRTLETPFSSPNTRIPSHSLPSHNSLRQPLTRSTVSCVSDRPHVCVQNKTNTIFLSTFHPSLYQTRLNQLPLFSLSSHRQSFDTYPQTNSRTTEPYLIT